MHYIMLFSARRTFRADSVPISFPEAAILLVSAKKSRPRGEIGRWASISYSGYFLYACSETVIELERMRTIKSGSRIFWFRFLILFRASHVRSPLTENARALGTRLIVYLEQVYQLLVDITLVWSLVITGVSGFWSFEKKIKPPFSLRRMYNHYLWRQQRARTVAWQPNDNGR